MLMELGADNNPFTDFNIYACPMLIETVLNATAKNKDWTYDKNGETYVYWDYDYSVKVGDDTYDCSINFDEGDKFIIEAPIYNVTVTTDGNGTASSSVASGKEGTEVTLTANPNPGYQFKEWQVISGNVTVENNKFVIADADVEIKAIFEAIPRTITVTTDGNGTASASAATGIVGDTITLTATPNEGYQFKEWQVVAGGVTITNNSFVIGTENVEIKAIFEKIPEPVKDPSFEDFVERLYTVALGRASEPEGKAFWVDQVVNKGFTGADCARFFLLDAPEFLGRGLTDDEFVEILYKTFFDRESEPDGKAYW
ncbi:MAG: DUF4214 domain-containing protein, partial [Lachnospiraceae bacterium]|nr:DUF4214 domain-containing protein [Lachnospiraceae bacterium]